MKDDERTHKREREHDEAARKVQHVSETLAEALPVPEDQTRQWAEGMRVLAQPQRLMILFLLRQKRRVVADIERLTGITQPMLSQHLGQLRRARLVLSHRTGRQTFYALAQTLEAAQATAILEVLAPSKASSSAPSSPIVPSSPVSSTRVESPEPCSGDYGAMFARLL